MAEIEYGARDRFVSDDEHLREKKENLTFSDYFTKDDVSVNVGFCYCLHDMGGMLRYFVEFPNYNKDGQMTVSFTTGHLPTSIIYADKHYNHENMDTKGCTWDNVNKTVTIDRTNFGSVTPMILEIVCME